MAPLASQRYAHPAERHLRWGNKLYCYPSKAPLPRQQPNPLLTLPRSPALLQAMRILAFGGGLVYGSMKLGYLKVRFGCLN